jgi:cyclohexyl-isocyanide hydratase
MSLRVGFLLYPNLTQLDMTGPYEVMNGVPGAELHTIWREAGVVRADSGLGLVASDSYKSCPTLDVLIVPGGRGQIELMQDEETLDFLRLQGEKARYLVSVCTGALLYGAAGLLQGYKAATHWAFMELLPMFGAIPVHERVVKDRNRITGGGVTAGIDIALQVVAEVAGVETAREIELGIEYNPAPPFRCGHPSLADAALLARLKERFGPLLAARSSN